MTAENLQVSTALAQSLVTNDALNGRISAMSSNLTALGTLLGTDNGNSSFRLPGTTPETQLDTLVRAINTLNHGQKQALYEALINQR